MLFEGVDFLGALDDVQSNGALFKNRSFRQGFPGSPHVDTEFISCRTTYDPPVSDRPELLNEYLSNHASNLEAVDTEDYLLLPNVYQHVMRLAGYLWAERVGRVMVVRLKPGGHVHPHKDMGEYHDYYDRYHMVLSGECHFRCGREIVKMLPGDVWWFFNNEEHEVWNDASRPRDHIIVDLKLRGNKDVRRSESKGSETNEQPVDPG